MPRLDEKPFAISKLMVWEAWRQVRANKGAPGVDGQDLARFEVDLGNNLYRVWNRMSSGTWFPPPVRAVAIPKPHGSGVRMLGVPTIADSVAQTVVANYLEARVDHRFHPDSYGYRPGRSAHDALTACRQRCWKYDWVIDLDVQKFFEAIPHSGLMAAIEERISDRNLLKLLRAMLRAGVMLDEAVTRSDTGTPQGGVLSPCLANVYLHRLDRRWGDRGCGMLVRYADDLLAMCRTRPEAERALAALTAILAELGLELKPAKTRIVHLEEGGEGLDFLGFHHRWVRGNTPRSRHLRFLARWPSRQATQRARDRIREITDRSRLLVPVETIVQDVNRFLRGWSGYFPLRKFRPRLRQDQPVRGGPPRAVRRQASQTRLGVRHEGRRLPVAEPPRADQPQRNHRRATTKPAVATGALNAHR
ncbi:MAG: group II intron reverse transcriptase/maturase [Solirubrobacteraceae bacterium]